MSRRTLMETLITSVGDGLLPPPHQQRTDRGHQRTTRAPARLRPRLPEPDEIHRQIAARVQRLQTGPTLRLAMNLLTLRRVHE